MLRGGDGVCVLTPFGSFAAPLICLTRSGSGVCNRCSIAKTSDGFSYKAAVKASLAIGLIGFIIEETIEEIDEASIGPCPPPVHYHVLLTLAIFTRGLNIFLLSEDHMLAPIACCGEMHRSGFGAARSLPRDGASKHW